MADYVVPPSLFYWMHVLHTFRSLSDFAYTVSLVLVFVLAFHRYCKGCAQKEMAPTAKKTLRWSIFVLVFTSIVRIFVPTKNAMTEMLMASMTTIQNEEMTIDLLKSFVDYIIEAVKSIA